MNVQKLITFLDSKNVLKCKRKNFLNKKFSLNPNFEAKFIRGFLIRFYEINDFK
jgi:hypothetical protein